MRKLFLFLSSFLLFSNFAFAQNYWTPDSLRNGGTINGDLAITGDLNLSGVTSDGFFGGNVLIAGGNSSLTSGSTGVNFETSGDMASGFPITIQWLSNKNFVNPFTDELGGSPTRVSEFKIGGGALNQESYFTSSNTTPYKIQGFIGSTTPNKTVFSFTGSKLGAAGATAGLAATEKFMAWGTQGNSMLQSFGDGSIAFTGKLAFDSSLSYPTSAVNYIANTSHVFTFNTESNGAYAWLFNATQGGRFTTPAAVSVSAPDVTAQLAWGNDYTDTYQFTRANTLAYLSNTFSTPSGALRNLTVKAIATNTINSSATLSALNGTVILDSGSFNNSSSYGGFTDARSQKTGGVVGQLTGFRNGVSFGATDAATHTAVWGNSSPISYSATSAGAGGTTTRAGSYYATFTKNSSDLKTVTEGAGLYVESFIASAMPLFSGFRMKDNTGASSLVSQYGINIDLLTAGTADNVGVYVAGASGGSTNNYSIWVDTGVVRLDGKNRFAGTAALDTFNTFENPDFTDPFTVIAAAYGTNAYGVIHEVDGATSSGGMELAAISSTTNKSAFNFVGLIGSNAGTLSSAVFRLNAGKSDGAGGIAALSATDSAFVVTNSAISIMTLYGTGNVVFPGSASVLDAVYGSGWNGSVEVPTKNAVYDKIETLSSLTGTSASIGGGALLAGACASTDTTVTGATVGMAAVSNPTTYPGNGSTWFSYVSAANTVTTKVCAIIALTPSASTYNIRVLQ